MFKLRIAQTLKTVFLLSSLALMTGCGGSVLYSSLPEQQANEIEAALLSAGIKSEKIPAKEDGKWTVKVPENSFPMAVALLEEKGLPRAAMVNMHEVFPKEGFVSSPIEERARYIYALSQELSSTIMEIDGVVSARVHVALPEKSVMDSNRDSASVSVVVIQEPDVDLSNYEIDIKAIITDGVEGLDDVNRVTVRFFNKRKIEHAPEVKQNSFVGEKRMLQAGVGGLLLGCGFMLVMSLLYKRKKK